MDLTCESCRHWCKQPADLANLRNVNGLCKEGPPSVSLVPTQQGLVAMANYPALPPNFQACDRHEARVEIVGGN